MRLKIIQEDHECYLATEAGERIENVRIHEVALPTWPSRTAPLAITSVLDAELDSRLTGSVYETRTVKVGEMQRGTTAFLSQG